MRIRRLKREEHPQTRVLYEEVFSADSASFVDYYYKEKTKDNTIYVAEEADQPVAMIHLNPYPMMVNQMEVQTHYIVAVATKQDYRRRGLMAELLHLSLRRMYENHEPFTFLMPAAEHIYLPHDFRTVYRQQHRYLMPGMEEAQTYVAAAPEDLEDLALWAQEELSAQYHVFVKRDPDYYDRLIKEYTSDKGILMVKKRDGKIVDCRPCISCAEAQNPSIMVRIVNVKHMLKLLKLRAKTNVCFSVTDPVIKENNTCLLLTGTEHSGVRLEEGQRENSEGTLPVSVLGELVFGSLLAEKVCEQEGVFMSDRMKQEWRNLIPLSKIYLNETV